jgi:hypothetical protein
MDPAGARALAKRIAQGKPIDEGTPASSSGGRSEAASGSAAAESGVEVVFVHPRALDRQPEVWMYVRGADGHLHRVR